MNQTRVESKPTLIEGNFEYCLPTHTLLNINDRSFGLDFINDLNVYKSFNKEYFQLSLPFNENLNIYTLNGNIFLANCTRIKKVLIYVLFEY